MNATTLRAGLPPLPSRLQSRPLDHRGYPVPWFVAWPDGKPDFRIMDGDKLAPAVNRKLCWICGQPLGKWKTFILTFSAIACPWLTLPKAQRRESNLPGDVKEPAGVGLKRNPGVVLLWTTLSYRVWKPPGGGILFNVGHPFDVRWIAEGRDATRAEVLESIRTGLPLLEEIAIAEGPHALRALSQKVREAGPLLPA